MPKRYAREFRGAICDRLVAGERVSRVSGGVRRLGGHVASVKATGPARSRPRRGPQALAPKTVPTSRRRDHRKVRVSRWGVNRFAP